MLNCSILAAEASKQQITSLVVLSSRLTTRHKVQPRNKTFEHHPIFAPPKVQCNIAIWYLEAEDWIVNLPPPKFRKYMLQNNRF